MTPGKTPLTDVESDLRTALVLFSFLVIQAEVEDRDLKKDVQEQLGPELKRRLESAADAELRRHNAQILAGCIVDTVLKKLDEAMKPSWWTRCVSAATRVLGPLAAGLLFVYFEKMPPAAKYVLGLYLLAIVAGAVIHHVTRE